MTSCPRSSASSIRTTAGPGGSDYSAFIERGIEALGLMTSGGAGHPDYHDAGDDAAKSDAAILGKTGQFVLQGMWNLANETTANLLIADRQVQYDAHALHGAGGRMVRRAGLLAVSSARRPMKNSWRPSGSGCAT